MVTRHSKQIPMPHSGPRGSPLTDRRYRLTPAMAMAVETMAPAGTVTAAPFTESVTESAMRSPGGQGEHTSSQPARRTAERERIAPTCLGPARSFRLRGAAGDFRQKLRIVYPGDAGALADALAQPQPVHDAADVIGIVAHAETPKDGFGEARRRPAIRLEASRPRTAGRIRLPREVGRR